MFSKIRFPAIIYLVLLMSLLSACSTPTPTQFFEPPTVAPLLATDLFLRPTDTPPISTDTPLPPTDTLVIPTQTPSPAPTTIPTPDVDSGDVELQVDPSKIITPFSNQMLGVALVNWEHSWGKPFPNDVPGLAQAMKAAKVGLVRYAGGLWANGVGWDREPQRAPYTEWSSNGNTYAFHYGSDEIDNLAAFAKGIDAQVMIQVNIAAFDPQMWADMVRYTNIEHDYGFMYWELGNEFDHAIDLGVDPDLYASRAKDYIDAMKTVDPNIIIVGGVPASAHDAIRQNWSDEVTDLSAYLTAASDLVTDAGNTVDSLSYHWYQACNLKSIDDILVYQFQMDNLGYDPYLSWRNQFSRIWSFIGPDRVQKEILAGHPELSQGITEVNVDSCDFEKAPQNSNHLNAVWAADVIGRLAYSGLDYLTWYTGYGTNEQGYPIIYPDESTFPSEIFLRPIYYTFFMYANYFGDSLVQSSSSDPENLSFWASIDSNEPGTLKLIVVNITPDPIHAWINLGDFDADSAEVWTFASEKPEDMSPASNTGSAWSSINGLVLDPMDIQGSAAEIQPEELDISGSSFDRIFEPFTVTAITLR